MRLTMPRRLLKKYLPDADAVRSRRLVAVFGRWLDRPGVWSLNRRSVPGALAIGLFCGLIPGPFQMLGALLLAVPLRQNVPVALATTLYTNPITIVPLYVLAYHYGSLLVSDPAAGAIPQYDAGWLDWEALLEWMMGLGKPLAVGLAALAVTLAAAGYVIARIAWRLHVVYSWRRRRHGTR